jgi:hypothetical protein
MNIYLFSALFCYHFTGNNHQFLNSQHFHVLQNEEPYMEKILYMYVHYISIFYA